MRLRIKHRKSTYSNMTDEYERLLCLRQQFKMYSSTISLCGQPLTILLMACKNELRTCHYDGQLDPSKE